MNDSTGQGTFTRTIFFSCSSVISSRIDPSIILTLRPSHQVITPARRELEQPRPMKRPTPKLGRVFRLYSHMNVAIPIWKRLFKSMWMTTKSIFHVLVAGADLPVRVLRSEVSSQFSSVSQFRIRNQLVLPFARCFIELRDLSPDPMRHINNQYVHEFARVPTPKKLNRTTH